MTLLSTNTVQPAREIPWLPVLFGLGAICMESTNTMGAGHTSLWLAQLIHAAGQSANLVELLNHLLRKGGHFTGYGLLGVLFARGWFPLLRQRFPAPWQTLRMRAGACGVGCAFLVACADEIHQIFLPTRGASVYDVMLDTAGAATLGLLYFGLLLLRRHSRTTPVVSRLVELKLTVAHLHRALPSRNAVTLRRLHFQPRLA